MVHNQILVHKRGPEQGFWHCFADRLNRKFNSICGAGYSNIVKMGMKRRENGRKIRLS